MSYLKVIRLGLSPTGGVWLQTMWATGRRTSCPCAANRLLRPTTSSIQAPPRFSAGLLYGSCTKSKPTLQVRHVLYTNHVYCTNTEACPGASSLPCKPAVKVLHSQQAHCGCKMHEREVPLVPSWLLCRHAVKILCREAEHVPEWE